MTVVYDKRLSPCPVCGGKAYVAHDIVGGFNFGWSVGCARFCIKDGIHGCDDYESAEKARLSFFYISSKEEAVRIWNERCQISDKGEKE